PAKIQPISSEKFTCGRFDLMKLADLLSALPFGFPPPDTNPDITAPVTEDSRQVERGGVFVARQGKGFDGHQYIPQAVKNGAVAIVGEVPASKLNLPPALAYVQVHSGAAALGYLAAAYYDYPSRRMVVIGITGTDGKTSTAYITYNILKAAG